MKFLRKIGHFTAHATGRLNCTFLIARRNVHYLLRAEESKLGRDEYDVRDLSNITNRAVFNLRFLLTKELRSTLCARNMAICNLAVTIVNKISYSCYEIKFRL